MKTALIKLFAQRMARGCTDALEKKFNEEEIEEIKELSKVYLEKETE